ncbi:MAG: YIP1 family protein [Planctomycetota bacterium]|jgi:hypothetical protein
MKMVSRIKGILLLDQDTFREVEHDEKATGQAALIVIVASILSALGVSFGPVIFQPGVGTAVSPLFKFLGIAFWAVVAWFVWSAVTYFIGTRIFHGEATYGEMLRVTGFAFAPMAFMILSAIPCIGLAIALVVSVWALGAVLMGVREGLDLDFGRTLVTVIVGWFLYAIGMGILCSIFGLF